MTLIFYIYNIRLPAGSYNFSHQNLKEKIKYTANRLWAKNF